MGRTYILAVIAHSQNNTTLTLAASSNSYRCATAVAHRGTIAVIRPGRYSSFFASRVAQPHPVDRAKLHVGFGCTIRSVQTNPVG